MTLAVVTAKTALQLSCSVLPSLHTVLYWPLEQVQVQIALPDHHVFAGPWVTNVSRTTGYPEVAVSFY